MALYPALSRSVQPASSMNRTRDKRNRSFFTDLALLKQSADTLEVQYGKRDHKDLLLLEEKNPVLAEFLDREHRLRSDVLTALAGQETENARARKESLGREFSLIEEARARVTAKE